MAAAVVVTGCDGRQTQKPTRDAITRIEKVEHQHAADRALRKPTRDEIIKRIRALGGSCMFDQHRPGKPITSVNFTYKPITDASLVDLKALPHLRGAMLVGTRITDAGLCTSKE